MKNFFIGLIIGIVIGGTTIVYADLGVLFDKSGTRVGTTANPIYVTIQ